MPFTKKDIKALLHKSGLNPKDFAKEIGVEYKTLRGWLSGKSVPTLKRSLYLLQQATERYGGDASSTELVAEETDSGPSISIQEIEEKFSEENVEAVSSNTGAESSATPTREVKLIVLARARNLEVTNVNLKDLRLTLKLPVKLIAKHLGCNAASYYAYEQGTRAPRRKEIQDAIIALWKTNRTTVLPSLEKQPTTRASVSAAALIDKSSRFFATRQLDLNRRLVREVVGFIAEEHKLEPRITQEALATFLVLLKDRLSVDEMYRLLTGHST